LTIHADIIVSVLLTDAFIQQPSTLADVELLHQLPLAFVGTATELKKVVALISTQHQRNASNV